VQAATPFHRGRADDGEIGHAHRLLPVFLDQGADPLLGVVARPLGFAERHQLFIDAVNQLQMPREDLCRSGTPTSPRLPGAGCDWCN